MGDRGDVALGAGGAGDVGKAQVAVEVRDLEAQALGHSLGLHEGVVCPGTPGLAGLGVLEILYRVMAHEAVHVCDDVLPNLVNVGINLLLELLVNHASSSIRVHSGSILAAVEGPMVHRRQKMRMRGAKSTAVYDWPAYTTNSRAESVMQTLPASVNR